MTLVLLANTFRDFVVNGLNQSKTVVVRIFDVLLKKCIPFYLERIALRPQFDGSVYSVVSHATSVHGLAYY